MSEAQRPDFRILPRVDDRNEHFWRGGKDGRLQFLRCQDCGYWIHPPAPICPECHSKDLTAEAVSGRAVLHTYTVNHQLWIPGFEPPYLVGIVELPEQEGLRLTTNVVGIGPDDMEVGMDLQVTFEEWEDVWLPLFEPVASS